MNKDIYLTTDELEELLAVVNELNPYVKDVPGTGLVKISQDTSSGIGSILCATITMKCGNYKGEFTTIITDENNW